MVPGEHTAYVTRMAASAGFALAVTSEINANPRDSADHEGGVWALPLTHIPVRHDSVSRHRRRRTRHGRGNGHPGGAPIFGNAVLGRVGLNQRPKDQRVSAMANRATGASVVTR